MVKGKFGGEIVVQLPILLPMHYTECEHTDPVALRRWFEGFNFQLCISTYGYLINALANLLKQTRAHTCCAMNVKKFI